MNEVRINTMKMEGKKMKIAVASEKDMVTQHFGHCNFNIFEVRKIKLSVMRF